MTAPTERETWAQAARVTSNHQRDHLIENIKGRLMTAPTEREAIARIIHEECGIGRVAEVGISADRIIAEHIEPLRAALAKAEERIAALETLRPYWAQGYSSDSVAAQALTAALAKAEGERDAARLTAGNA